MRNDSSSTAPPAAPPALNVLVNGEKRTLPPGTTVSALLAQLGHTPGTAAVERNREVVHRAAHATTELCSGDEVEVVTFVGGG